MAIIYLPGQIMDKLPQMRNFFDDFAILYYYKKAKQINCYSVSYFNVASAVLDDKFIDIFSNSPLPI